MKHITLYLSLVLVLALFLLGSCTLSEVGLDDLEGFDDSEDEDDVASCPPLPNIPLGACSEMNGRTEWIYDEQSCIVGYECAAAPVEVEAASLDACLARCEEPDYKMANELPISQEQYLSNYYNCQVSCYNHRAQSTKLQADCNHILEFARQNPDGYYPRYFYCVIDAVGLSDPALCDVARDDANLRTNYPYCINKLAIKTKDATVCERLSGIDQDNFYHDNCVGAIERGY